MKKFYLFTIVVLVLLFHTAVASAASSHPQAQFLNRDLYINGTVYHNEYLEDPFVTYHDVTYIPLNSQAAALLGFQFTMDWTTRVLEIEKTEPASHPSVSAAPLHNLESVSVSEIKNVSAKIVSGKDEHLVAFTYYPLLRNETGDLLYLPIRALTGSKCFGCTTCYDINTGIFISTDPDSPASANPGASTSAENKALLSYICEKNHSVSQAFARELVFLFRHESRVSGQSVALLAAIAEKESTFYRNARSSTGSTGLMQIQVSTAKGYGYSVADLYDPHKNIELGARILKENIARFGSAEKALAAYNQGAGAISRGQMRSAYYTRVLRARSEIQKCLTN